MKEKDILKGFDPELDSRIEQKETAEKNKKPIEGFEAMKDVIEGVSSGKYIKTHEPDGMVSVFKNEDGGQIERIFFGKAADLETIRKIMRKEEITIKEKKERRKGVSH